MPDPGAAWAMYVAQYDTTRYHSRIIPDSIRVLQTSRTEISTEQLEAERERTGLGVDLQVTRIDAHAEATDSDLADLAARQIAAEPAFDFFEDVVGDDIVFMGIVYSADEW